MKARKYPYRDHFSICDLPLDICLFAIPALFLHKFAVFQSHHGLQGQKKKRSLIPPQKRLTNVVILFLPADHTNPGLPVVCGGLLERLVELEFDFSCLECALRLQAYSPLLIHGHYQVGLGSIPHLPGCKSYTCTVVNQGQQNAWNTH